MKGIIALLAKRAAQKKPSKDEGDSYADEGDDEEPADEDADATRAAGVSCAKDIREAFASKDDEAAYDALCELIKNHAG